MEFNVKDRPKVKWGRQNNIGYQIVRVCKCPTADCEPQCCTVLIHWIIFSGNKGKDIPVLAKLEVIGPICGPAGILAGSAAGEEPTLTQELLDQRRGVKSRPFFAGGRVHIPASVWAETGASRGTGDRCFPPN